MKHLGHLLLLCLGHRQGAGLEGGQPGHECVARFRSQCHLNTPMIKATNPVKESKGPQPTGLKRSKTNVQQTIKKSSIPLGPREMQSETTAFLPQPQRAANAGEDTGKGQHSHCEEEGKLVQVLDLPCEPLVQSLLIDTKHVSLSRQNCTTVVIMSA